MNLHEYQAKALFADYGIQVPEYGVVRAPEEVDAVVERLGGDRWVVKAQAHTGGRGKAGGVRIAEDKESVRDLAESMLGTRLVTYQTDARGKPVNEVLIESPCDIDRELYLGMVIDRATRRIVVMASREGGVDIEKVAAEAPQKILRATIHPLVGLQPYQCRDLAFGLGLQGEQIKQFCKILAGLARAFAAEDMSLVEINPLVVTREGNLLVLDAKVNIDDNALYRHPDTRELRDLRQEDPREVEASEWDLSYIALDGNIGCMVNGAGLAMATMDLIKLVGGSPANFLDVGGTATKERVAEAFKIILADSNVKGILVNIFGGIVRCDIIAEGIIGAVEEAHIGVPVVVRLEGTNADIGRELLRKSGLQIIAAEDLTEAAQKIVSIVEASS
ncbi:MAG TPA: ADP-forming succinate--CoA ligase subunit beta [Gammaproteobacteria bacterium]|nr:ADP-forming succinate--CoA ligase subunit beta [Gammaproteobacteria bacterium]